MYISWCVKMWFGRWEVIQNCLWLPRYTHAWTSPHVHRTAAHRTRMCYLIIKKTWNHKRKAVRQVAIDVGGVCEGGGKTTGWAHYPTFRARYQCYEEQEWDIQSVRIVEAQRNLLPLLRQQFHGHVPRRWESSPPKVRTNVLDVLL